MSVFHICGRNKTLSSLAGWPIKVYCLLDALRGLDFELLSGTELERRVSTLYFELLCESFLYIKCEARACCTELDRRVSTLDFELLCESLLYIKCKACAA